MIKCESILRKQSNLAHQILLTNICMFTWSNFYHVNTITNNKQLYISSIPINGISKGYLPIISLVVKRKHGKELFMVVWKESVSIGIRMLFKKVHLLFQFKITRCLISLLRRVSIIYRITECI